MQVDFYHLAGAPGAIVARIAERILAEGGRLLVVADEAGIEALDTALWTYSPDSFLPHGRADRGDAGGQPVLLSFDCRAENGARAVAITDGLWRDEALGFDRAFHFFDETTIGAARLAWKQLADRAGVERRYWKQEGGRWSQVA
jgi:DNA polymerase-3 subunit chi